MTMTRDKPGDPALGGDDYQPTAPTLLSARGIAKAFKRGPWPRRRPNRVLKGVDMDLHRGEIVGLVGENGSGKSTLMSILVGALSRDSGTVHQSGRIGFCPQDPILYERLTCDEHFELFARAYGVQPDEFERSRAMIYEALGFGSWADARVEALSGGTRAKLNLGLALLPDPDILLLDEPYAGFDWDTYQRFWELTAERRAGGRGLLIISHFIADEERFDRVLHLVDGTIAERTAKP